MIQFLLRIIYYWFHAPPSVGRDWLRDNRRRECGIGIDQSRTTWPWKGWME